MNSNLIKQLAACGNHAPAFFFLVLRVCNFIIELSSETKKRGWFPHKLDIKSWVLFLSFESVTVLQRSFNSPQSSWVLAGFSVLLIYLRPHRISNSACCKIIKYGPLRTLSRCLSSSDFPIYHNNSQVAFYHITFIKGSKNTAFCFFHRIDINNLWYIIWAAIFWN